MTESFILIPGRTSRQGTTLNEGKLKVEYIEETNTVQIAPEDMERLSLPEDGLVTIRSEFGEVTIPCTKARKDELPPGLLFIPYGDASSKLMGGETHGTGMPDSKGIDVELSIANSS